MTLREPTKQQIIDKLVLAQKEHDAIYDELEHQLLARSEKLRTEMKRDAGIALAG